MGFIIWLVVGGLVGWLGAVSLRMRDERDQLLAVLVGIVGAFVGGLLFGPVLGARMVPGGDYGPVALLAALGGAALLLALVLAFRRRPLRPRRRDVLARR